MRRGRRRAASDRWVLAMDQAHRSSLVKDETPLTTGWAQCSVANGYAGGCLLTITDERLLWSLSGRDDVIDLRYDSVVGIGESDDGWLRLTYEPADFPASLRSVNPEGQLDADFLFTDDDRPIVIEQLRRRAPFFAEWRESVDRFRANDTVPITTWKSCPMCQSEFAERTEHVARCQECGRYFGDPGYEPDVSQESETYGRLVGERAWMPLLEADLQRDGHTLAWILVPPGMPVPVTLLYDYELLNSR